jgi:tRNA (guanine-N7-)-methyltransferase
VLLCADRTGGLAAGTHTGQPVPREIAAAVRILERLMADTTTGAERPIRTFHPRRGRMSSRHTDAVSDLWATHGLDLPALFRRDAPCVFEIGFGMGETTARMAAADPGRGYLAVEVHTPGVGNLLALVAEQGLDNVRVARGDAMELTRRLAPGSLDAVHIYFPDPWPKARHHKRRLIRPPHVALLSERLRIGGILHCATDWEHYAEAMAATLDAEPALRNLHDGFAPRPAYRPMTKFERRGVQAGRRIFDLVFQRT